MWTRECGVQRHGEDPSKPPAASFVSGLLDPVLTPGLGGGGGESVGGVVEEWDLVCSRAWEAPFNESAYMAGMCLGFVVGGWLSDRLGRRVAFLSTGMAEFVLCILACLSPHHMFYASIRFLIASCFSARVGVTTVVAAELTTARYRSILSAIGSIIQLTVHRVLIGILAYFVDQWRILTACMLFLYSGVLILFFVLPESPKWLAARGRTDATGRLLYAGYRTNVWFTNLFSKRVDRRNCMSEGEFLALISPPGLSLAAETEEEGELDVPAGDVAVEMHASKQHHSICRPMSCELAWTTFLAVVLLTCQTTGQYGMVFYSMHIRFHVSFVVAINAVATMPGCFLSACLYKLFRFRKKPLLFSTTMANEYADLKQMLQQQLKLMEALTVKLSNSSMGQSSVAGGSHSVDHIASSITQILYDPQAHITFDSWYKRYEDLFPVDLAAQDDAWKVRLLLRKLGPTEHEHCVNCILPKNPREVTVKDTVQTLSQIFGEQSSLFNIRFQCLQQCKRDSEDFITYASIVNRERGRFQLGSPYSYLRPPVPHGC
nr:unnamed protein product [Spirometra erinaceieuropaei]